MAGEEACSKLSKAECQGPPCSTKPSSKPTSSRERPAANHDQPLDQNISSRAKYACLAKRSGPLAKLRLGWFGLIAALRNWRLPDQSDR